MSFLFFSFVLSTHFVKKKDSKQQRRVKNSLCNVEMRSHLELKLGFICLGFVNTFFYRISSPFCSIFSLSQIYSLMRQAEEIEGLAVGGGGDLCVLIFAFQRTLHK